MSACPICESGRTTLYCRKEGYPILRCGDCGNGFLDPASLAKPPLELYREGYHRKASIDDTTPGYDDYFAMEPALRRKFGRRLGELLRLQEPRPGARLLDVGCGPGFFLRQASSRYEASGIELGREAVDYARGELGLDVRRVEFGPGVFPPETFDAITMFDFIEHVERPVQVLRLAAELLRPGGLLMLNSPDLSSPTARLSGRRWHLFFVPEHLIYFTRAGLEAVLEREGFDIVSARYPANLLTADYLVVRLLKAMGGGRSYWGWGALRRLLQKVVVPVNMRDEVLVVARKRGRP